MKNSKSKSLLVRLLSVICAFCCALALVCGLVGCGDEAVTVSSITSANGVITVTYSDGNVETIEIPAGATGESGKDANAFDKDCTHDIFSYTVQPGTCVVDELVIEVCTKCFGHEIVNNGKLADVHGEYVKLSDIEGADVPVISPDFAILDTSCVKPIEANALACVEHKCELCQAIIPAHGETVQVEVKQDVSRKCVTTTKVVDTCKTCYAVVGEIYEIDPTGHNFATESADHSAYVAGVESYKVKLTCKDCGAEEEFDAVLNAEKSQAQTCKEGGYDVYTIEYDKFVGCEVEGFEEILSFDTEKVNKTDASDAHTFVSGDVKIVAAPTDILAYDSYTEVLDVLFADKTLETIGGKKLVCDAPTTTVGRCAVCENQYTFGVIGKHDLDTEAYEKATCTVDGYTPCKVCNTKFTDPTKDMAEGHKYVYVKDSFDAVAMTADFECSVCKDPKTGVAVEKVDAESFVATSCDEQSYNVYKATLANFPAGNETHKGNDGNINYNNVVKFQLDVDTTDIHVITVDGKEVKLISNDEVGAPTYTYTVDIEKAFIAKQIEWNGGNNAAGDCQTAGEAIFRCEVCNALHTISLKGPHAVADDAEVKTEKSGHELHGYTYYDCDKGCRVFIDVEKIAEHKFEIDQTLPTTLVENETLVKFACECGVSYDAVYTGKNVTTGDACYPNPTTTYLFKVTYEVEYPVVEGVLVGEAYDKTVTVEYSETEQVVSHRVVYGEIEIDGIDPTVVQGVGALAADATKWEALVAAKVVEWNGGDKNAATCAQKSEAIFRCADCGTLQTITLPGTHQLKGEPQRVEPKCGVAGEIYDTCTVVGCTENNKVVLETIDALEHDIKWTFSATVKYNTDGTINMDATNATGVAKGECQREGCTEEVTPDDMDVVVTCNGKEVQAVQNCCHTTVITFTFYYGVDAEGEPIEVGTYEVVVNAIGTNECHSFTVPKDTSNPAHGKEIVIELGKEVEVTETEIITTTYTAKWCYAGQCYVEQAPIVTREAIPQA